MKTWADKLGENFYRAKGLEKVSFHISPDLKKRLYVAGASQKKRLSLDKMAALIIKEHIGDYEKGVKP